jgi:hypothetical protein
MAGVFRAIDFKGAWAPVQFSALRRGEMDQTSTDRERLHAPVAKVTERSQSSMGTYRSSLDGEVCERG